MKTRNTAILFLSLFVFSPVLTFCQSTLNPELTSLADTFDGRIGIMARNLSGNDSVVVNANRKFPSASVIKVPVMVEFFHQVSEGRLDPEDSLAFKESDKWGGSGILQYMAGMDQIRLIDAVMLMIILSDNSATNLVIDALGGTHEEALDAVNSRMKALGLENTRLLNKMMSWETKTDLPESIRYGVGVTTPADMVILLEKMARLELPFSKEMIDILKNQQYNSMIPRYLPLLAGKIEVAHKTGGVSETKNDVGIVFSEKGDYVVAIFCDESNDHRDSADNAQIVAAAKASRMIWSHFTGDQGMDIPSRYEGINWSYFPKGRWAKIALQNAPFPHADRMEGFRNSRGEFYALDGHYDEGAAVLVIPEDWREKPSGIDLIVHFHGHRNEVLRVLEKFRMPQQLIASKKNAILVLAQGPKNAPDSFGGKMEDPGGFRKFIFEVLQRLKDDGAIANMKINSVIISAHSGGYRPAAFVLDVGDMPELISEVWLFDAFYGQHKKFMSWIEEYDGKLISIYTAHLRDEHEVFTAELNEKGIKYGRDLSQNARVTFYQTEVCHNCVLDGNFRLYLELSGLEER